MEEERIDGVSVEAKIYHLIKEQERQSDCLEYLLKGYENLRTDFGIMKVKLVAYGAAATIILNIALKLPAIIKYLSHFSDG